MRTGYVLQSIVKCVKKTPDNDGNEKIFAQQS